MTFLAPEPFGEISYVELNAIPTAVIVAKSQEMAKLQEIYDSAFSALGQSIAAGKFSPAGAPFGRYTRLDPASGETDLEIGFPVAEALTEELECAGHSIIASELPAGKHAAYSYFGSYDGLHEAWSAMMNEVMQTGYQLSGACFEAYVSEPTPETDPATLRTDLYCPVS